jgi:ABC-type sugar transport system ATPase subunit
MGRMWFFPFNKAHFSAYLLQDASSLRMSWALMREAPILVLDEPTAALDPQNEWHFFQQLLSD